MMASEVHNSHACCTLPLFYSAPFADLRRSRKGWQNHLLVGLWLLLTLTSRSRCPPVKYIPNENELLESESLEIIGEDRENGSLRTGGLPVRVLTEFSVFDREGGRMIAFNSLLAPDDSPQLSSHCAAGYVFPVMEDEVEAVDTMLNPDPEDYQYLRLSTICSTILFDLSEEYKVIDRYSIQHS